MVFKRTSIPQKTSMMTSIYVEVLGKSPLFPTINLKDFVRDPTKPGGFWKEEGLSLRQKGLK